MKETTKQNAIRILHLEDVPDDAELIELKLRDAKFNCEIKVVDNRADFIKELRSFLPNIILADHTLPGFNSLEALAILKYSGLKIPFILISGHPSEDYVVTLLHEGMDDYLLKGRLQRLPAAISNALEKYRLEKQLTVLMQQQAADRLIKIEQ